MFGIKETLVQGQWRPDGKMWDGLVCESVEGKLLPGHVAA